MNQVPVSAQPSGAVARGSWVARAAYGSAIAVSSALASFLFALSLAPHFWTGERWEAFGMGWATLGLPLVLVLGLLSAAVAYPVYRRRTSWVGIALVFFSNVFVVTTIGLVGAIWGAGL